MDAIDWESIIPIFSPLYECLHEPKGLQSLLPLNRFLGDNADVAMKTVNNFAKDNGFKVVVSKRYQKHGPMLLTCECYGEPPKLKNQAPKKRQYSSKKCNCPYMFRVYCFDKPTKLRPPLGMGSMIPFLQFLPGVYIYEYPNKDHTCNRLTVREIHTKFEKEVLYIDGPPSEDLAITEADSQKFWDHALVLYCAGLPQDRAFQILGQTGFDDVLKIEMSGGLTPKRLYSRCRYKIDRERGRGASDLDAQHLLDLMHTMKEADPEFYFKFILDNVGSNCLEGLCWGFPFMAKRASKVGLRLLIFDTTHESNRFGCYTCVLGTESEMGETEILFMALIMHQDTEGFAWVFRNYIDMIREQGCSEPLQPQSIMTDGDAAIKAAIKLVWPATYHLLCIWHIIDKNAADTLKKAIGQENSMQVCSLLWATALNEDARSTARFDEEWIFIVDFVNAAYAKKLSIGTNIDEGSFADLAAAQITNFETLNHENACVSQSRESEDNELLVVEKTSSRLKCDVNFINNLYSRKAQWVRRFIVEECLKLKLMLGHVKTTQRVESLNRVIAEDTSPSNSLIATFESLHERQKLRFLELRARLISEVKAFSSLSSGMVHPIFEDLIMKSTRFVSKKIRAEISQINDYFFESRPSILTEGIFVVTRNQHLPEFKEIKNTVQVQFQNKFKLGSRNVTSKIEENGRLYLECTCMLAPICGYPCRHILFIYSIECTLLAAKEKLAPIMSYLHPYWLFSNCLANFQITKELSFHSSLTTQRNQEIEHLLSIDDDENIKLLEKHETKIHELKAVCKALIDEASQLQYVDRVDDIIDVLKILCRDPTTSANIFDFAKTTAIVSQTASSSNIIVQPTDRAVTATIVNTKRSIQNPNKGKTTKKKRKTKQKR